MRRFVARFNFSCTLIGMSLRNPLLAIPPNVISNRAKTTVQPFDESSIAFWQATTEVLNFIHLN
jgi:hypothetical protein